MANWDTLKAAVSEVIKTNGNQEITGALLQSTLNSIISNLGENYQFIDIAIPTTTPGEPDGNVFYLAQTNGTYANFGGIILANNEIAILKYNGTWSKVVTNIASIDFINSRQYIGTLLNYTTDVPTTRLLIPANTQNTASRRIGTMISYKSGYDLITEQYVGATFTDTEWVLDDNWQRIATKSYIDNQVSIINSEIIDTIETTAGNQSYSKTVGVYSAVTRIDYLYPVNGDNKILKEIRVYCSASGVGKIKFVRKNSATNFSLISEFNYTFIEGINIIDKNTFGENYNLENGCYIAFYPITCAFCYLAGSSAASCTFAGDLTGANVTVALSQNALQFQFDYYSSASKIDSIKADVTELKSSVEIINNGQLINATLTAEKTGKYYSIQSGNLIQVENANSKYYDPIDLSNYAGKTIEIRVSNYSSTSSRIIGFGIFESQIIKNYKVEANPDTVDGTTGIYRFTIPFGYQLILSYNLSATVSTTIRIIYSITNQISSVGNRGKDLYVATNGSDYNDGGINTPLSTINSALQRGANVIYLSPGVYDQKIDLSKLIGDKLSIKPLIGDKVIIEESDNTLIADGSEVLVSGYTKVYSFSVSADPYLSVSTGWLFQENAPEVSTLITDDERMPQQRGKEYRCDCMKISRCVATTLNLALAEIESSNVFKYYVDSGTIYLSRPISTNGNPIRYSKGNSLFLNAYSRKITVNMVGIDIRYMIANFNYMTNPTIIDCSAGYVRGAAAFQFDNSVGVRFVRCEALRCFDGLFGDGFNAHSIMTGTAYEKMTTATLEDCWSHDNNDDGVSTHERSEINIIGGLYEYNHKAGVTPSYGAHYTCKDVYSRKNWCGFYYTGSSVDGGKYGQVLCQNCIAENNNLGGLMSGFITDILENRMILIGCKSIGHTYGYNSAALSKLILIDCSGFSNTNNLIGNGIVIKNTNIIQ